MSKMFPLAVFVLVAASASAQNPAMNGIGLTAPSVLVRETCPQVSTSNAGTSGTYSLCSFRGLAHQTWREAKEFGYGLETVPRNSVRVSNLKWELPILATTGILIAKVADPQTVASTVSQSNTWQAFGRMSVWGSRLDRVGSRTALGAKDAIRTSEILGSRRSPGRVQPARWIWP